MAPSIEKKKKSFCQNFKSHLTPNRALLPLKLVMFLFYGGATIFLPYVTLHMLQVGITVQEVGIIYAILPFAACFGPPTAGMIADKLGNYKVVLMAAIVFNAGFHTLLTTIDAHGIDPAIVKASNQMSSVFINCDGSGQVHLEWSSSCANDTCPYENSILTEATLRLMPANCIHFCTEGSTETDAKFCLAEEAGCRTLDKSIHLKMALSESKRTESPDSGSDICSMTINELMLFDSAQSQSPLLDNSSITKVSMTCECPIRCPATLIQPKNSCSTNQSAPEYDHAKHNRGFWLYLIIRILATASLGTSFVMLDASTLCLIKKHKGDLGKQRLFGVIGSAVFGLLSGILLDWASSLNNGVKDYAISFYFADAVFVVVLFILVLIEVSAEKAQGSLLKNVVSLVKFIHIDMFLLILLTLGTFWGFLEAFLFVFLVELKATSYLLGMTVTVGAIVGIPFLFVSDIIVKKVGPLVVLISAFFLYSLRFIGYSFIQDPWLSLPFEALEIVTIHLMGVAFSLFCASAAPVGLLATLQGMAGAMHYSIGRGIGSFVGGTLIAIYGTRVTFQILGTSASVFGVFFIIIYLAVLRKYERKSKPKPQEPEQKHLNVIFYPVNNFEDQ